MASVPITELKAELAKYLRMARRGVEVQVLDRGVPVARIVGMPAPRKDGEAAALARLVAAGLVRQGEGDARLVAKRRIAASAAVTEALDEDREDRV